MTPRIAPGTVVYAAKPLSRPTDDIVIESTDVEYGGQHAVVLKRALAGYAHLRRIDVASLAFTPDEARARLVRQLKAAIETADAQVRAAEFARAEARQMLDAVLRDMGVQGTCGAASVPAPAPEKEKPT